MFVYEGNSSVLKRAVEEANKLIVNYEFLNEIKIKKHFDMATCDPKVIARDMEQYKHIDFYVKGYYKRFTRALAYFDSRYPDRFFINEAKLNRSFASIVATLIHEWVHFLDHLNKNHYYGHGDNRREGKQNTAPYWIDNLAQHMISGQPYDFNNNESSNIVRRRPNVFRRVGRWFRRLF